MWYDAGAGQRFRVPMHKQPEENDGERSTEASYWVLVGDKVAFGELNRLDDLAFKLAQDAGLTNHEALRLRHKTMLGQIEPSVNHAYGEMRGGYPTIHGTNVDRNWVYDRVMERQQNRTASVDPANADMADEFRDWNRGSSFIHVPETGRTIFADDHQDPWWDELPVELGIATPEQMATLRRNYEGGDMDMMTTALRTWQQMQRDHGHRIVPGFMAEGSTPMFWSDTQSHEYEKLDPAVREEYRKRVRRDWLKAQGRTAAEGFYPEWEGPSDEDTQYEELRAIARRMFDEGHPYATVYARLVDSIGRKMGLVGHDAGNMAQRIIEQVNDVDWAPAMPVEMPAFPEATGELWPDYLPWGEDEQQYYRTAAEWRPESEGMIFQEGDRVQLPDSSFGTIVEDYGATEEEDGTTTIWWRVKKDDGAHIQAADSHMMLVEGVGQHLVPDTIPWGEGEQHYYRTAEAILEDPSRYQYIPLTEQEMSRAQYHGPFESNAHTMNLRAKRMGLPGRVRAPELMALFNRYEGKCAYCGRPFGDTVNDHLTFDHVVPLQEGGDNVIDNILPAHHRCNQALNKWQTTFHEEPIYPTQLEWARSMPSEHISSSPQFKLVGPIEMPADDYEPGGEGFRLEAWINGEYAGDIRFLVQEGPSPTWAMSPAEGPHLWIVWMNTEPRYRRQGVMTALMNELKRRYPGYETATGGFTDEGAAWKDAYNTQPSLSGRKRR